MPSLLPTHLDPPTINELDSALSKQAKQVVGLGCILLELIVHMGTDLGKAIYINYTDEVMQKVWEEQKVVSKWWDAFDLVPRQPLVCAGEMWHIPPKRCYTSGFSTKACIFV